MSQDIVRVMRLIIYEGPRDIIEDHLENRAQNNGTKVVDSHNRSAYKITCRTLNEFPEIIKSHEDFVDTSLDEELESELASIAREK